MAVLQKIREKSGLLIGVIGFCLLAFIAGDLLSGGINFTSRNVGEVNGTAISAADYTNKINNLEQSGQGKGAQLYNQVWTSEVRTILFNEQLDKAGLRLGKDQLINVIKTHPSFSQNPQFLNDAGQFDINKFNTFLAQMKAAGAQQWNAWLAYEDQLGDFAKEQMYMNMIKGAIVTTTAEAKIAYKNEATKVSFDYVTVPFNTVNDDQVKVTDDEINSYVKKHAKQFKTTPSRKVEYVFVANKPSKEDEAQAKQLVEDLLKPSVIFNQTTNKNDTISGFTKATDVREFVNLNSDVPFDSTYYAKEQLPAEHAEKLFNEPIGSIYGPYVFNDYYAVSKVIAKKNTTETVDASHILIAYKGAMRADATVSLTKEEAKAKAEALLKQAQSGADFAALATENTNDSGSKATGGKYPNIQKGQMVPTFDQYIFNNPIGKLGIVESDFGFHVLKVDKINEKEGVQLATIAKKIESSTKTQDQIYSQANKFLENVESGKDFAKEATAQGLTSFPATKINPFDEQLIGVEGSHTDAIRWASNSKTKVGDVKKFDSADGYLVVKLVNINDTELMDAEDARSVVEPILMNEKKAEIIRKQMAGNTLEEVSENAKVGIVNAIDVTGANPMVNGFQEPLVVGNALGRKINETSKLINGRNGVYMVKTKNITKAVDLPNYLTYKQKVGTNNRQMVQNLIYSAMYQNADIKDNRHKVLQ
ncbi:peptidyl-prolyl cis-trans isomerase D [Paenimyroides aquimaris]|uniref:Periplasmic chaperone PpiD n=1 Tax=Paenimyroides marinum TaxID=1159016 RepID=A0A1H6KAK9_9FLAO|nr:peptidylprolyl isomerase [Paenimyroides aquimaris]SEH70153.1 peptidyl-prolyl cis-trans isomerase D [Paenimyroides aquimaris]